MRIDKDGNIIFSKSYFKSINTVRNPINEASNIISIILSCAEKLGNDYIITGDCLKKINRSLVLYVQKLINKQ